MELTCVELPGSTEIVALVEKATAGHSGGEREGREEGLLVDAPGMSRHRKGTEVTGRA